MRSTISAKTSDALCNNCQRTLLPSFICSGRLSCNSSRWPKPWTPKVLDDLNIWSEANTSDNLHLTHVPVSIKSVVLDAVCEILKLTLKRHQSEVWNLPTHYKRAPCFTAYYRLFRSLDKNKGLNPLTTPVKLCQTHRCLHLQVGLFGSETMNIGSTNVPSRWIPAIKQVCPKCLDFCAGKLRVQLLVTAEIFNSKENESVLVSAVVYVGWEKGLEVVFRQVDVIYFFLTFLQLCRCTWFGLVNISYLIFPWLELSMIFGVTVIGYKMILNASSCGAWGLGVTQLLCPCREYTFELYKVFWEMEIWCPCRVSSSEYWQPEEYSDV